MRVVILGGGYTSIWCYRALRRWMGESAHITVVAPFTDHVFHGFTGEVLDGELSPALQTSPLEECVPKAERVRGWATAVDADRRVVAVEWDGGTSEVGYDQLVVATGAHDRTVDVPGLAEHGWPLRFPGKVQALLDHLSLVDGESATGAVALHRSRTIVVVGAGFAGTEVAAALGRRYGATRRIVLASSSPTVVPVWQDHAWLQERPPRNLDAAGVALLSSVRVAAVDGDGVLLADGTRIEAATVVSTMGNTVPMLPGLERFQGTNGLFEVDECLRVTDGVWSAGDAAAVRTRGGLAPKEALWAIRAGTTVGRNIARTARTARPRRFGFRGLGTVAAFAPGRAVAMLWGIPLPEFVGWAVRAVLFLWYVPSRRTTARILRWTLGGARRQSIVAQPAAIASVPVAMRIEVPVERPVLVGLDGGLVGLSGGATAADRLRAAATGERERERRAAGA